MIPNHQGWEIESINRQWELIDARLESALSDKTIDYLVQLRQVLLEMHRDGLTCMQVAKTIHTQAADAALWLWYRGSRDEAEKVTMLLGAVSVAIAWQTYCKRSAPASRIQKAIAAIEEGHPYLLPIPRHQPCFCGSGTQYKHCHGHPPVAA